MIHLQPSRRTRPQAGEPTVKSSRTGPAHTIRDILPPMSAIPAIRPDQPGQRTAEATLAHQCLYYMLLMRELEDRIERKLYRQGKIVGGVYVGRGQEAIPVGSALVARADDVLFPSHRDMAVFQIG